MTHNFGRSNKWNSKNMKLRKDDNLNFHCIIFLKTSHFSGVSTGKNNEI